jgi:hypothetical protein
MARPGGLSAGCDDFDTKPVVPRLLGKMEACSRPKARTPRKPEKKWDRDPKTPILCRRSA